MIESCFVFIVLMSHDFAQDLHSTSVVVFKQMVLA